MVCVRVWCARVVRTWCVRIWGVSYGVSAWCACMVCMHGVRGVRALLCARGGRVRGGEGASVRKDRSCDTTTWQSDIIGHKTLNVYMCMRVCAYVCVCACVCGAGLTDVLEGSIVRCITDSDLCARSIGTCESVCSPWRLSADPLRFYDRRHGGDGLLLCPAPRSAVQLAFIDRIPRSRVLR